MTPSAISLFTSSAPWTARRCYADVVRDVVALGVAPERVAAGGGQEREREVRVVVVPEDRVLALLLELLVEREDLLEGLGRRRDQRLVVDEPDGLDGQRVAPLLAAERERVEADLLELRSLKTSPWGRSARRGPRRPTPRRDRAPRS